MTDARHALNCEIDTIKPAEVPVYPEHPLLRALALMGQGDARMERAFKEVYDALEDSEASQDHARRGSQPSVRKESRHTRQGRKGVYRKR